MRNFSNSTKIIFSFFVVTTVCILLAGCVKSTRTSNTFDPSRITSQDYIEGIKRWTEQDYGEAIRLLQQAVDAGKRTNPESPETAYMEIKLGEFLIDELGRYADGLEYEISAFTTFKKLYGVNDYNTILAAMNISSCDIYLGNHANAISQLISLFNEVADKELKGVIATTLAHAYSEYGDMDGAKEWFELVRDELINDFQKKNNIGAVYNEYGLYLCKKGEERQAIEAFIKAVECITDDMVDERPNECISLYTNLASAYFEIDEDVKGFEVLKEAYNLSEKSENEVMLALCMEEIAHVLLTTKRYISGSLETAKQYLDTALDMLNNSSGENNGLVAKGYNLTSQYYKLKGDHTLQIAYLKKAIEIRKNLLLSDTMSTATLYINLADAYLDTNQYDDCIACVDNALVIIKKLTGEESYNIVGALAIKAWAYCGINEREDAIRTIDYSINMCNQQINKGFPKDSTYAYVMLVAGIVYLSNDNPSIDFVVSESWKKGMGFFYEAEEVYASLNGENSIDIVLINLFRGDAQVNVGDKISASESYKKAYSILKTMGADTNTIVDALSERLFRLYRLESTSLSEDDWLAEWLSE